MKITRQSALSGNTNTMDIEVTENQIALWQGGVVIQRAMPNLTPSEREFIMTGIIDSEWDAMGGE
jgi:hypothetical protein